MAPNTSASFGTEPPISGDGQTERFHANALHEWALAAIDAANSDNDSPEGSARCTPELHNDFTSDLSRDQTLPSPAPHPICTHSPAEAASTRPLAMRILMPAVPATPLASALPPDSEALVVDLECDDDAAAIVEAVVEMAATVAADGCGNDNGANASPMVKASTLHPGCVDAPQLLAMPDAARGARAWVLMSVLETPSYVLPAMLLASFWLAACGRLVAAATVLSSSVALAATQAILSALR